MPTWQEVWSRRRLSEPTKIDPADRHATALMLDGYDSPTAGSVTPADFVWYARDWAQRVGLTPADSVYEVGSGCGAFLAAVQSATGCDLLAGCDLSAALVEAGRSLFPDIALEIADARAIPSEPRYEHVVSFGMFEYLSDLEDADAVLRRMQAKATRSVSVLDVPDVAHKEAAEVYRRSGWEPDFYEERYEGLEHLHFDRRWFRDRFLADIWSVEISGQRMPNYGNAPFTFDAVALLRT